MMQFVHVKYNRGDLGKISDQHEWDSFYHRTGCKFEEIN